MIYLSHPQAKEISLGCAGRNYSNELYAKANGRKPKPAFLDLVASAAAIIFTLPKDDMLKGVSRCIKRMGLFRGDDVTMRYRRLDMAAPGPGPRPRSRSRAARMSNGASQHAGLQSAIFANRSLPVHHAARSGPIARILTMDSAVGFRPATVGAQR